MIINEQSIVEDRKIKKSKKYEHQYSKHILNYFSTVKNSKY